MASDRNPFSPRSESDDKWEQRGNRDRRKNESRPYPGRTGGQKPSGNQGKKCGGRGKSAPQIVENFPSPHNGGAHGLLFSMPRRTAPYEPRQKLPVSTSPTVLPRGSGLVARRKFL